MNKVRSGDPLKIKASDWNSLIDAAQFVSEQRNKSIGKGLSSGLKEGEIRVLNDTGTDLPIYSIVAVWSRIPTVPDYDQIETYSLESEVYYRGKIVQNANDAYAILQEPLKVGEVGRAKVTGVTPVRFSGDTGAFAFPNLEAPNTMLAGETGTARVLASHGGGDDWGIVVLGCGGGASAEGGDVYLCEISSSSANAGTYNVDILSLTNDGQKVGSGRLMLTEIALGSYLPAGTRVLGHKATVRKTGGSDE